MTIHPTFWFIRSGVVTLLVALTIAACSGVSPTKDPTAGNMMPNLTDYDITDVQSIQDAVAKRSAAAWLASGQPEATGAIAALSSTVSCFQSGVGPSRFGLT